MARRIWCIFIWSISIGYHHCLCEQSRTTPPKKEIQSPSDIQEFVHEYGNQEFFVLGGGSNIVAPDHEIKTPIAYMQLVNSSTKTDGDFVEINAGAGMNWDDFVADDGVIDAVKPVSANVAGADEAAKNVAMQAAAMNPIALNEAGVDAAIIEKEIEIAKEQLRAEGKPEAMLDNISKGKIQRFYKDNTLVNQDYIKDGSMSVAAYIKSVDANLTVSGFKRVALG